MKNKTIKQSKVTKINKKSNQQEKQALKPTWLEHVRPLHFCSKRKCKAYLVNEIKSNRPLTDSHFLGLPVFPVLGADLVNSFVKAARRFILLPVFLTLQDKQ